jgi:hypothetical protein
MIGVLVLGACTDNVLSTAPVSSARPTGRYMSSGGSTVGSSSGFGINIGTYDSSRFTDAQLADLMDAVVDAGAQWVRVTVYWNEVEHDSAQYNLGNGLDRTLKAANARGLSIYAVVSGVPEWASPSASGPVDPPNLGDWQQFLGYMVQTYPYVDVWSIMNEANCDPATNAPSHWSGTRAEYDTLFARAAAVIPAGHITLGDVVFGAPDPNSGIVCIDPIVWLNGRLNGVVVQHSINVPIVAIHTYGDSSRDVIRDVRQAVNNVSGGRPVWLTEFNTPTSLRWDSVTRDSVQTRLIGGVLNGMRTTDGWEKSFVYRLWADDEPEVAVLEPGWTGTTYPRKDQWHMFRIFAQHGGTDWIPTYRWWRQWDGMVGTDPNEGYPNYMLQSANDWSGSRHGFHGWRPLFRCVVSDPATNNGHYVGTRHTCDERLYDSRYPALGTNDSSYGYASLYNWPDVGLVPLYRFSNDALTDYVQTTSASEVATLRSPNFYADGWRELDILGYVWPIGFTP